MMMMIEGREENNILKNLISNDGLGETDLWSQSQK